MMFFLRLISFIQGIRRFMILLLFIKYCLSYKSINFTFSHLYKNSFSSGSFFTICSFIKNVNIYNSRFNRFFSPLLYGKKTNINISFSEFTHGLSSIVKIERDEFVCKNSVYMLNSDEIMINGCTFKYSNNNPLFFFLKDNVNNFTIKNCIFSECSFSALMSCLSIKNIVFTNTSIISCSFSDNPFEKNYQNQKLVTNFNMFNCNISNCKFTTAISFSFQNTSINELKVTENMFNTNKILEFYQTKVNIISLQLLNNTYDNTEHTDNSDLVFRECDLSCFKMENSIIYYNYPRNEDSYHLYFSGLNTKIIITIRNCCFEYDEDKWVRKDQQLITTFENNGCKYYFPYEFEYGIIRNRKVKLKLLKE